MKESVDFIGIGTAKSATTWVMRQLSQHPEVCTSEPKEIGHFNYYQAHTGLDIKNGEPPLNPRFNLTKSAYMRHFSHCSRKIIGEFTNAYFSDPKAPEKIRLTFPGVKLLLCLRNPVDRAYSHYNMYRHFFRKEPRNFLDIIDPDEPYIDRGMYAKYLRRWLQHFPREDMHLIFFDDVADKPSEVLNALTTFLAIRAWPINGTLLVRKDNPSRQTVWKPAPLFLDKGAMLLARAGLGGLTHTLKRTGLPALINRISTRPYSYEPLGENTRERLVDIYREDLRQLEQITGRDLSSWRQ